MTISALRRGTGSATFEWTDVPAGDLYYVAQSFVGEMNYSNHPYDFKFYANDVEFSSGLFNYWSGSIEGFEGGSFRVEVIMDEDWADGGPWAFFWGIPELDEDPSHWTEMGANNLITDMPIASAALLGRAWGMSGAQRTIHYPFDPEDLISRAIAAFETGARYADAVILDPFEGGVDPGLLHTENNTLGRRPPLLFSVGCEVNDVNGDDAHYIASSYLMRNPSDEDVARSMVSIPSGFTNHFEFINQGSVTGRKLGYKNEQFIFSTFGFNPCNISLNWGNYGDFQHVGFAMPSNFGDASGREFTEGLPHNKILIQSDGTYVGGRIDGPSFFTYTTQESDAWRYASNIPPSYTDPTSGDSYSLFQAVCVNPMAAIQYSGGGSVTANPNYNMVANVVTPTYRVYGVKLFGALYLQVPGWRQIPRDSSDGVLKLWTGASWHREAYNWWHWDSVENSPAPLYIMTSTGWAPTALLGPPSMFNDP